MRGQELIAGMVVGAGAMYLLDPDRGVRRRSLLRDRGVHAGHRLGHGLAATARDARNRTIGAAAELRSRFRHEDADDAVLHDRVRSAIGRVVSHPAAISVTVSEGRVTLSGHVLTDEVDGLTDRVQRVRGVREVSNELETHSTADGVLELHGGRELRVDDSWSPTRRLVLATAGGVLAFQGARTRGAAGKALGAMGVGLLARAATNLSARSLVGLRALRRAIEVEKTLTVAAPVEQVWEVWSNFENFPRFMSHLREVRKIDEGRSHWVAAGPAGVPVEWDAIVTDWVPNQFIGWESIEGSTIETSGRVRFRPLPNGKTEIDVQLSYSPPAGAAGHAIASLFGADPKRAMDEDLGRLRSLLEEERTGGDSEPVRLEEATPATRSRRSAKSSATTRRKPRE